MIKPAQFTLRFKVRDYECDLQGIVNNANYQHYTEHTRHEFLHAHGVNFAEMHQQGLDAVVARMTMNFKMPLRSGDRFVSKLWVERKGARFVFHQDLFKADTGEAVVSAVVSCVCLSDGKLDRGDMLAEVFKKHLR